MHKTRVIFNAGDSEISFEKYNSNRIFPTYIKLHDNEQTAYKAAHILLSKHGGCFLNLLSNKQREMSFRIGRITYKVDPNRIFSYKGIHSTLKENNCLTMTAQRECKNLSNNILSKLIKPHIPIVALHNNFEDDFTIDNFEKGKKYGDGIKSVSINKKNSLHDFFYLIDPDHNDFLAGKGFNTVLQDEDDLFDDGSFSYHCTRHGIEYINIETRNGHLEEQVKMGEAVLELFAKN